MRFSQTAIFHGTIAFKKTSLRWLESISRNKTLETWATSPKIQWCHDSPHSSGSPKSWRDFECQRVDFVSGPKLVFTQLKLLKLDSKTYGGSNCTTLIPGSFWRCTSLFGVNQSINQSIHASIHQSINQPTYLAIYLSIFLPIIKTAWARARAE